MSLIERPTGSPEKLPESHKEALKFFIGINPYNILIGFLVKTTISTPKRYLTPKSLIEINRHLVSAVKELFITILSKV